MKEKSPAHSANFPIWACCILNNNRLFLYCFPEILHRNSSVDSTNFPAKHCQSEIYLYNVVDDFCMCGILFSGRNNRLRKAHFFSHLQVNCFALDLNENNLFCSTNLLQFLAREKSDGSDSRGGSLLSPEPLNSDAGQLSKKKL